MNESLGMGYCDNVFEAGAIHELPHALGVASAVESKYSGIIYSYNASEMLSFFLLIALFPAYVMSADPILFTGDVPQIRDALNLAPKDLNTQHPNSKQTPLMAAVLSGRTEVVKFLLSLNADTTVAEKDGYNPPHGAAFRGRPEIMQLLIDHKVPVNDFHSDGFAPLHRACWGKQDGHAETVQVLINSGIDKDLRSTVGIPRTCKDQTNNPVTLEVLAGSTPDL